MLGTRKTPSTRQAGPRCLYPSPSFLSKNHQAKEGPDSIPAIVIPALVPSLDKSVKADRSLCPVRALTLLSGQDLRPQAEQRTGLCLLQERF